jgi:hypothetical protein
MVLAPQTGQPPDSRRLLANPTPTSTPESQLKGAGMVQGEFTGETTKLDSALCIASVVAGARQPHRRNQSRFFFAIGDG